MSATMAIVAGAGTRAGACEARVWLRARDAATLAAMGSKRTNLERRLALVAVLSIAACAELPRPECRLVGGVPPGQISIFPLPGDAGATPDVFVGGPKCITGSCPKPADPCKTAGCVPNTGCVVFQLPQAAACDDGDPCTTGDICVYGDCAGTNACADEDPCTLDVCLDSGCAHPVKPNTPCNDGIKCTAADMCTATGCKGTPLFCDDSSPCTTDACLGGACVHIEAPTECDDSNPCTADACQAVKGCVHSAKNGPCADGSFCTETKCLGGKCAVTKLLCVCQVDSDCDDNGPACLQSICSNDQCVPTPAPDGSGCDDNVTCTVPDICKEGICVGLGNDGLCDDAIECTDDACTQAGCVHTPDDGRCDDGNSCSDDFCNPKSGCDAVDRPDGSECMVGGVCKAGQCI